MLTRNIYTIKLVNVYSKRKNKKGEEVVVQYSVTLKSAMNNVPENEDYDDTMPTHGAQYVVVARTKNGRFETHRFENNEDVNAFTKKLDSPDDDFYQ